MLWRDANLGLLAAIQMLSFIVAMIAWRPTERDVTDRAWRAAGVTLAGTVLVTMISGPEPGRVGQALILLATAMTAVGTTTTDLALLELFHRSVDSGTTVRTFTVLDVVGSSSLQAGLAVAGLLITASARTRSWPADPYQILITAAAAATFLASLLLRGRLRQP